MTTKVFEKDVYHCAYCPNFKVNTFLNPFGTLSGGCKAGNFHIFDATHGEIPAQCPLDDKNYTKGC